MKINYGKQELDLSALIPQNNLAWSIFPHQTTSEREDEEIIIDSLEKPIGTEKLSQIAKHRSNAIIVVDDITRPTPTKEILPIVVLKLNNSAIQDKDIKILVASGMHRVMNQKELYGKYGENICRRIKILQHNCQDKENLIDLGVTNSGISIKINKYYYNSDLKIVIGNIVPHVNAGWSGGAKMLLPGISGKQLIDDFHLKASQNIDKIQGKVDNIIRCEMEGVARKVGLDFLINTILSKIAGEVKLLYMVAGHYIDAHRKGVELAKKIFGFTIDEKADLTIVSSYPMDADLWQASKALTMATMVTKSGGSLVLVSPCYEGIAPDHPIVIKLATTSREHVYSLIEKGEIIDKAGAAIHMEINSSVNNYKVYLYSSGISRIDANTIGFTKIDNLHEFIKDYIYKNSDKKIGVINMGSELVPLLYKN